MFTLAVTPERIRKRGAGHTSGAKRRGKFFVVPSTFLALRVPLVVLAFAFVMVSTVWPVSCLLSFYGAPVPYGIGATEI